MWWRKIQGMDPVWVTVAVPESIARLIKRRLAVRHSGSRPGRAKPSASTNGPFSPASIAPPVPLQLRLQVNNPDEALKPGMNAYLKLTSESAPMLLIPSKALIDSGSEQRVITVDNEGRFVPKNRAGIP